MLIDLNNDGHLDIIVVVGDSSNYELLILFQEKPKKKVEEGNGTEEHSFNKIQYDVKNILKMGNLFKHHPVAYQTFDEKIGQLRTYMIVQKHEDERVVIYIERDSNGTDKIIEKEFRGILSSKSGCKQYEEIQMNKISNRFSGAFIDLDMDCRPDLLIEGVSQTGRVHEIYFYTDDGFCLVDVNQIPEGWSHVSFLDIDQTGSNDAVFMEGDLKVNVFLNKYHIGGFKKGIINLVGDELCQKNDKRDSPFESYKDAKTGNVINSFF